MVFALTVQLHVLVRTYMYIICVQIATFQQFNAFAMLYVIHAVLVTVSFLSSSDILLSTAACSSLAEIGRSTHLPLPDVSDSSDDVTKKSVVDTLLTNVKTDNVHRKVSVE